jgi:hypothetical protein
LIEIVLASLLNVVAETHCPGRSQFKANPVNTKILQNPATGVRKVPSKPPTQVEEFNLEGQKRNQNKYIDKKVEKYEFRSQNVPATDDFTGYFWLSVVYKFVKNKSW